MHRGAQRGQNPEASVPLGQARVLSCLTEVPGTKLRSSVTTVDALNHRVSSTAPIIHLLM